MCQLVNLSHFEPNKIQNGRQNVLKIKKRNMFDNIWIIMKTTDA